MTQQLAQTVLQGKTVDLHRHPRLRAVNRRQSGRGMEWLRSGAVRPPGGAVVAAGADARSGQPEPPVAAGDCQPLESGFRRSLSVQNLTE